MKTFLFSFLLVILNLITAQSSSKIKETTNEYLVLKKVNKVAIELGFQENDFFVSFASYPLFRLGDIVWIEGFLTKLESEWGLKGKQKDFWKRKKTEIKQQTKGFFTAPIAFLEVPLYEVLVQRKNKKNEISELKVKMKAKQLALLFDLKSFHTKANELYFKGGEAFRKRNFEQALLHFKESYQLCVELGTSKGILGNLGQIGRIYVQQKKYLAALDCYKESLPLAEKIGKPLEHALCLMNFGMVYARLKQYEKSVPYYREAVLILRKNQEQQALAFVLNQFAQSYISIGEYQAALECFQESLALCERLKKEDGIAGNNNSIGRLYFEIGKFQQSFLFYEKALAINKKLKNPQAIANVLKNIGNSYVAQGEYEKALPYLHKAIQLNRKLKNLVQVLRAYNSISALYEAKGDYKQALHYASLVLKIMKKKRMPEIESFALNVLATISQKQGKYQEALTFYQQSLTIRKSLKKLSDVTLVLNNLGLLYQKMGQYQKALDFYQKALNNYQKLNHLTGIIRTYNNLGTVYYLLGKNDVALEFYQQSLNLSKKENLKIFIASGYDNLGVLYNKQRKFKKANESLEKALFLFQELGQNKSVANVMVNIASSLIAQGKRDEALLKFQAALLFCEKHHYIFEIGLCHSGLGEIYFAQGKKKATIAAYKKALTIFQQINDLSNLAVLNLKLGSIWSKKGDYEKSLHFFQEALQLNKKLERWQEVGKTLRNIGIIYQFQGKFQTALFHYQEALKLLEPYNSPQDKATILNSLGFIYFEWGNFDLATDHFQKSLKLAQTFNLGRISYLNRSGLGRIYNVKGQYKLALEIFNRLNQELEKGKNWSLLTINLGNLGMCYFNQQNYQEALKYYSRSLALRKKMGDSIAFSLGNIGSVFEQQGKLSKALDSYQEALVLHQKEGALDGLANTLNNIGSIYQKQGNNEKALETFQYALEINQRLSNPLSIAVCLGNLGATYYNKKEFKKALQYHKKALKMKDEYGFYARIPVTLNNIANIYWAMNQLEQAKFYFQKTLQLAQKYELPLYSSKAAFHLALFYVQDGQKIAQAKEHFLVSIDSLEKAINLMGSGRTSFIQSNLYLYHETLNFMLKHNEYLVAFHLLQKFKAFGFLAGQAELSIKLEKYVSPSLIQRKNSLLTILVSLNQKLLENSSLKKDRILLELKQQILQKENELAKVIEEIRIGNPAFANIQYPKPATLEKFQKELAFDEVFLEYVCTSSKKKNSRQENTFCFIIGKEFFHLVKLGSTPKLQKLVQRFRLLIWESSQEESRPEEYYELGIQLYSFLLEPVLTQIQSKKIRSLIIAPDADLHQLAFDAICLPQSEIPQSFGEFSYVLDEFEVSYTMSATVFHELKERIKEQQNPKEKISFLGIGAPHIDTKPSIGKGMRLDFASLPGTKEELEAIAFLLKPTEKIIRMEEEASEANFFLDPKLKQYQIIHFATHGIIDLKNPMRSSLLLTQLSQKERAKSFPQLRSAGLNPENASDGFLQLTEICSLYQKIQPVLVVLSACETGLGELKQNDGVIGFSRVWHFSGAFSLVVSLWPIHDKSTSEFMPLFYQNFLSNANCFENVNGLKRNALYVAKRNLRARPKYCAPYYWAPFILVGLP